MRIQSTYNSAMSLFFACYQISLSLVWDVVSLETCSVCQHGDAIFPWLVDKTYVLQEIKSNITAAHRISHDNCVYDMPIHLSINKSLVARIGSLGTMKMYIDLCAIDLVVLERSRAICHDIEWHFNDSDYLR